MSMAQRSLLEDWPALTGLHYFADIVSAEEEETLLREIARLPLKPFEFQQWLGQRRVASFGWRYDYAESALLAADEFPDWLQPLRARAAQMAGLPAEAMAQVLITEYDVGTGIGWHRDRPDFDKVVGVSLLSSCTLRFRRRLGPRAFERSALLLEPRSAYLLDGPARHEWEHGIAAVERRRYSLTFRSLRPR